MTTKNRCFVLAIALSTILTVVWLGPGLAAVQAPSIALRTPWGEPDLQGIWSNPFVTPLERPKEFGTRQFLTADEIGAEERRLREQSKGPGRDNREGTGTERDVARAYNEHWFGDPSLLRGTRTSL